MVRTRAVTNRLSYECYAAQLASANLMPPGILLPILHAERASDHEILSRMRLLWREVVLPRIQLGLPSLWKEKCIA